MKKTSPNTGPDSFTTPSMRRLVNQAQMLLGENLDPEELDRKLAELTAEAGSLGKAERVQLEEIARLLTRSGVSPAVIDTLRRDAIFELVPTDDRMFMVLSIQPAVAGGRAVETQDVIDSLKYRGINRGVDVTIIQEAVNEARKGKPVHDVVAARGRHPQEGEPEHFEVYARRSLDQPLESVTPAQLERPDAVFLCKAGDRILVRVPATAGVPGYDALGKVLPPTPSTHPPMELGPNTACEGDEYFAKTGGVVAFNGQRLEVRRALVINHDVTRQDGVIEFDGEVMVRGAVRSGAVIKASGAIVVDGAVESATIESTAGDVRLRHGVAGRGRGSIRAAGDLFTRFAENTTLYAGNDIIIEVGALRCRLVAGRAIRLATGRGQLLGGVAMAGAFIEVKQLGARSDVVTEVSLGLSRDIMERVGAIDEKISDAQYRAQECAELADQMQRAIGDPAKLSPPELATYTRLRQVQVLGEFQARQLTDERNQVLAASAKSHHGHVDVIRQMMPKAIIRIGGAVMENQKALSRCRLVFDEKAGHIITRRLG